MKKKTLIITISVLTVLCLAVLFLPINIKFYDDGGTCEYNALTYKIVAWNKYTMIGQGKAVYKKTAVYWYPNNQKDINELWKMEMAEDNNDIYYLPINY